MIKPRAYTKEEMREAVLQHIAAMAHYWGTLKDTSPLGCETMTPLDRCNGLAFSFLTMIDGSTMDIPALNLVPSPHPEDKEYHIEEGTNYWEEEPINNDVELHDQWRNFELKETQEERDAKKPSL